MGRPSPTPKNLYCPKHYWPLKLVEGSKNSYTCDKCLRECKMDPKAEGKWFGSY